MEQERWGLGWASELPTTSHSLLFVLGCSDRSFKNLSAQMSPQPFCLAMKEVNTIHKPQPTD